MIDIVVTMCDRLPLLKRTLSYIWDRTTTPYRLHVIDDASRTGNVQYLKALLAQGKVASVHLHTRRLGPAAHLRAIGQIATSDPVVLTDDDILCPRLDPDWLARGLEAMGRWPGLGLLALNNPHCNVGDKRHKRRRYGPVTTCLNVGGTFLFARRSVLKAGYLPADGTPAPIRAWCVQVRAAGGRVGYLTDVYCQHIGAISVRNGRDMSRQLERVRPIDPDTLEPADAYKG